MGTLMTNKRHDTSEGNQGEKAKTEFKSEQNTSRSPLAPDDEGNKCSICQDAEIFTDMYALPCAHKFHERCINEWLKKKSVCPICRLRIGHANDVYDEGLGEDDNFERFRDDMFSFDSSISPITLRFGVEYSITDVSDGEDEQLLSGQYNGDTSNIFSRISEPDTNESDTDLTSNESDAGLYNEFDADQETRDFEAESEASESETETETSESYDEPEVIELDDGSETSKSDNEQEVVELDDGSESSESDDEQEVIELDDGSENSESDDEPEPNESDDELESSESDDEPEPNESDDELEISESDSESEYESYSE